jgi:mono/diheme cytochrome c family protein
MKTLLFLAAMAFAAAQAPGNAENGKRLFEKDGCYECHGYAGQGGRDGPRIAATSLSSTALIRYVRRPFGAMPAYTAKVLSDQDLADIYAYLKAFPQAKPAKDIPLLNQLK